MTVVTSPLIAVFSSTSKQSDIIDKVAIAYTALNQHELFYSTGVHQGTLPPEGLRACIGSFW